MTAEQKTGAVQADDLWPELKLASWQDSYSTLHMLTQIVGKTRLALAPMENHWWQVPLYVTERGLTTSAMPYGGNVATVDFDFIYHNVGIRTSAGQTRVIPLVQRPVREFYIEYLDVLAALGIGARIRGVPVEVETAIPFAEDTQHASYDPEAVNRWWRAMVQVDRVLKQFRGRFEGKASPVHFFWGSFDIAATRFSGRGAPLHPGGAPNCPDYVMQEAYSRECSSAGFWPGGGTQEAAFYSYAYPEPDGYRDFHVGPDEAYYDTNMREFILPYDVVRTAPSPDETLLAFLESTYEAAASRAAWDRNSLERRVKQ
ncbi:MAG TPA: DUF5996 family protein [Gemmatimonadaceae bacterium]|nr:DUF5996 family protein [Gemmatimonadaceae bacterium]